MEGINIQFYKTRYTEFIIGSYDKKLCLLDFRYRKMRGVVDNRIQRGIGAEYVERRDEIIDSAISQVDEYLVGGRRIFDVPLLVVGSYFQKKVWNALMEIKYGETSTYSDLAKTVGDKEAIKAVAGANGANSISLIIPCHRIIGTHGELVGYGGGLPLKKRLLEIEQLEDKQLVML